MVRPARAIGLGIAKGIRHFAFASPFTATRYYGDTPFKTAPFASHRVLVQAD